MANKKISELNSATLPLDNTELVPIVQGGETKKVSVSDLKSDKLDKVTTSGVERAYIINADGSQGTKATSEFGSSTFIVKDFLVATNLATTWRFRTYQSGTSYTPTVLDSGQTNFLTALTGTPPSSIPYQTHSSYIAPFDTKLKSIQVIITNVFAESANINLGFGTHLKIDGNTTVTDGVSILEVSLTKTSFSTIKKKYTTADFGDVTILSGHSLVVGWINQGRGVEIYFEMEKA
jgi:hypothetical protein